jgi:hypothetical protein
VDRAELVGREREAGGMPVVLGLLAESADKPREATLVIRSDRFDRSTIDEWGQHVATRQRSTWYKPFCSRVVEACPSRGDIGAGDWTTPRR